VGQNILLTTLLVVLPVALIVMGPTECCNDIGFQDTYSWFSIILAIKGSRLRRRVSENIAMSFGLDPANIVASNIVVDQGFQTAQPVKDNLSIERGLEPFPLSVAAYRTAIDGTKTWLFKGCTSVL
jgi:hypothetical protein